MDPVANQSDSADLCMATAIPVPTHALEVEPINSGPKRSQPLQHSQLAKLLRAHIRPSKPEPSQTDPDPSPINLQHPQRNMGYGNPNSLPAQSVNGPLLAFPFFRAPEREALHSFQQRPQFEQQPHQEQLYAAHPQQTVQPATLAIPSNQTEQRTTPKAPTPSSTPSVKQEPVEQKTHLTKSTLKDGLKWRKYGQKALKNSPYPRTYYRCTTPECGAKKQIEKYIDPASGQEMYKTVYVGEHIHLNPVFLQTKVDEQENFQASVLAQTGKTGGDNILEIECAESIDCNNDGFSWRKYGQKKVKGGPHQRAYYKCSISDCEVKKTIEQTESGGKLCTYNGNHTHAPDSDTSNDLDRPAKKQKVANSSPSLQTQRNVTNVSQGVPIQMPRIKEEPQSLPFYQSAYQTFSPHQHPHPHQTPVVPSFFY